MSQKLLLCLFLLVPSCVLSTESLSTESLSTESLSTESECEETMREYMTHFAKDIIHEEVSNVRNFVLYFMSSSLFFTKITYNFSK